MQAWLRLLLGFASLLVLAQGLATPGTRPRILVIGGSGRVGGSAVRSLLERDQFDVSIGGRDRKNFDTFLRRNRLPFNNHVKFQILNIYSEQQLDTVIPNYDVIVHTAGPFQGLTEPGVLANAIKHGKKYVDVMDDVGLSRIARSFKYQELANETGAIAVVSAGIWPGGSSLLAKQAIDAAGGSDNVKSICFDFFTAGSGNAGITIITATFLILGEDVLVYEDGQRKYFKSATNKRVVDFGEQVGEREVVRLNLIECESCHVTSGVPSVQTNFGTAPPFWNRLFALMATLVPKKVLQDRDLMEKLALFSMPIIRLIDTFVGSKNSIKVTCTCQDGTQSGAIMVHPDLEAAVGDALAAFVVEIANLEGKTGVFYPEEMPKTYREAVLKEIKSSSVEYRTW